MYRMEDKSKEDQNNVIKNVREQRQFRSVNEGKRLQDVRMAGMLLSILLGLQMEALFYYVFGINPVYIPVLAIVILWVVNSVLVGCVVDEYIKRKYQARLYPDNVVLH